MTWGPRMPATTTVESVEDVASARIDEARARVEQLHDVELELYDRRQRCLDDMVAATVTAGDQILEAIMSGRKPPQNRKTLQLHDEVAAIDEAVIHARRRRAEAILESWKVEAAEEWRQSAELLQEAEKRQVRTDELLAALKDHEGCDYVPYVPQRHYAGETIVYTTPATDSNRRIAAGHSERAAALEAREVSWQGWFNVASRDELIERVRTWNSFQIGPVLTEALDWFDEGCAKLSRPLKEAEIHWRDGVLDLRKSRIVQVSSWEVTESQRA